MSMKFKTRHPLSFGQLFDGEIDFDFDTTSTAIDWDLKDNDSSALSFDTADKAGLLNFVTTDGAEGVSMSGFVSLSDGAAATPSLRFTTDPDTGVFYDGVGQIGITAGGAQGFRFTGSKFYGGQNWAIGNHDFALTGGDRIKFNWSAPRLVFWENDPIGIGSSGDLAIQRLAAGVLAVGNQGMTQGIKLDTSTDSQLTVRDESGNAAYIDVYRVQFQDAANNIGATGYYGNASNLIIRNLSYTGQLTLSTNSSPGLGSATGNINIFSGAHSGTNVSGTMNIYTGAQTNAGDYDSGPVNIYTGATTTDGDTGDISLATGAAGAGAADAGDILLYTNGTTAMMTLDADLSGAPAIVLHQDLYTVGSALDWDLIDNNASALSFDSAGKAGILNIVTTDGSEGVTMSGDLAVTGNLSVTGSISGAQAFGDDVALEFGDGPDYWLKYNSTDTAIQLWTTNSNGAGADDKVLWVGDGAQHVHVRESLYFNNDVGRLTGGGLYFNASAVALTSEYAGGSMSIYTGDSGVFESGIMYIATGAQSGGLNQNSGAMNVYSGAVTGGSGQSGITSLHSGNVTGTGNSGHTYIYSGVSTAGTAGNIVLSVDGAPGTGTTALTVNGTDGSITLKSYTRYIELQAGAAVLGGSAPTPTAVKDSTGVAVGRGLGFDSSVGEVANVAFCIPEDWDGASDMYLTVVWTNEDGDALADTEDVDWYFRYRVVAVGEVPKAAALTSALASYTQSGAGTDSEIIATSALIDYDDATNPLAANDCMLVNIVRNLGATESNSYSGLAVAVKFVLSYVSTGIPSR